VSNDYLVSQTVPWYEHEVHRAMHWVTAFLGFEAQQGMGNFWPSWETVFMKNMFYLNGCFAKKRIY
jgi:hypothetical protein